MIDQIEATTEIRRLSRLKNYPRSWEQAEGSAAAEQDQQAEVALIEAAVEAPSMSRLRQFIADWERRHVEAPVPATLYEAWRAKGGYQGTRRREKCDECGDTGWVTLHFVSAAISGDSRERIYIGNKGTWEQRKAEINEWWERIRGNRACAQRVYDESVRCGCGNSGSEVRSDFGADAAAYRDFAQKAARDIE